MKPRKGGMVGNLSQRGLPPPADGTWGFGNVVAINLHTRYDRWAAISAECDRVKLEVSKFEATLPFDKGAFGRPGARGCHESHLAIIKDALRLGSESILILEDDAMFAPRASEVMPEVSVLLSRLEWDVLFLYISKRARRRGAMREGYRLACGTDLVRIDWSLATHAWAIHRRAMPVMVEGLKQNASRPIDVYLSRRVLPSLKVYGLDPDLATQNRALPRDGGLAD